MTLKKGDHIEYEEWVDSWKGRIVSMDRDILYLELDRPVSFMRAPEAIDKYAITQELVDERVHAIGVDTMQFFEDKGVKVPRGKWTRYRHSHSRLEYILTMPLDLNDIIGFCSIHYPMDPLCWVQAVTLRIVPISLSEAKYLGAKITKLR